MARLVRDGNLVRIFAKNSKGQETLVAFGRRGADGRMVAGYRKLRFYDFGLERTYTSTYQLGMAPARAKVFHVRPEHLRALFSQAGLPVPTVKPPARFGRRLNRARHHAVHGVQAVLDRMDRLGAKAPQQPA